MTNKLQNLRRPRAPFFPRWPSLSAIPGWHLATFCHVPHPQPLSNGTVLRHKRARLAVGSSIDFCCGDSLLLPSCFLYKPYSRMPRPTTLCNPDQVLLALPHTIYPSIRYFQIVAVYLPLCPVCLSFLLCLFMCCHAISIFPDLLGVYAFCAFWYLLHVAKTFMSFQRLEIVLWGSFRHCV